MFSSCTSLKSLDIPASVTSIGDGAFSECDALAHVKLPDCVTKIGDMAFMRCKALEDINLPLKIKSVCHHAFMDCSSLKTLSVPSNIGQTWFDGRAFSDLHILVSKVADSTHKSGVRRNILASLRWRSMGSWSRQ